MRKPADKGSRESSGDACTELKERAVHLLLSCGQGCHADQRSSKRLGDTAASVPVSKNTNDDKMRNTAKKTRKTHLFALADLGHDNIDS